MLSINGIYTGKEIRPLEEISVCPNVRVIITFLEDEPVSDMDRETQEFLELCGTWEDERSPEEIVREIYESRTAGEREILL
ncbi:MAG: hypothetical protein BWK80_44235 [Desulfobacteraceae bacterium IS3]|nr:MAG: hypothetical protein BWK80_44235 [Desulfobacteraceae bacterium IS3]